MAPRWFAVRRRSAGMTRTAALLGGALSLFVSAPAAAQDGVTTVWSATMTVGEGDDFQGGGGGPLGYCKGAGSEVCEYGSLSDDDFTLDGTDYTVESLRTGSDGADSTHLTLDRYFPSAGLGDLTLQFGSTSFALSSASPTEKDRGGGGSAPTNNYKWDDPSGWDQPEAGDVVVVKILSAAPTPTFDPASGARAAPGTNVTLTFAEPIRKDDSNAEFADGDLSGILTLKMTDGDGSDIGYSASLNDAKTVITIDPTSDLAHGPVHVAISNQYWDVAGNQGRTAAATFTVGASSTSPTLSSAITDRTIVKVGGTEAITLADHFSDADGDTLTFEATSDDETKATAAIASGALTVTGVARGSADVTVTATDDDSNTATDTFAVTVKGAPAKSSDIAAVTVAVGATVDIDLTDHFTDPDGDTLTFSASCTPAACTRATLSVNGGTLEVRGDVEGSGDRAQATARDADGNTVLSNVFDITVTPEPPAAPVFNPKNGDTVGPETNITLTFGEAIKKNASNTDFMDSDLSNVLTLKTGSAAGTPIAYSASINDARKIITIDPSEDLAEGDVYVAISNGWYDADGIRGAAANATFTVSTSGICSRTAQVRTAILDALTNVNDCADVTAEHLTSVTGLDMAGKGIASLKPGDFEGLSGPMALSLAWNNRAGLTSLPAGLLDEISNGPINMNLDAIQLTDDDVADVVRLGGAVMSLRATGLTATQVDTLLDGLSDGLDKLYLDGNDLAGVTWSKLSRLVQLDLLGLNGANLNDEAAAAVTANVDAGVSELRMSYNSLTAVPSLSRLTGLRTLTLQLNDLDEADLTSSAFAGPTNLSTVELWPGNPGVTRTPEQLTNALPPGFSNAQEGDRPTMRVTKLVQGTPLDGNRAYGLRLDCVRTGDTTSDPRVVPFSLQANGATVIPVHAPGLRVALVEIAGSSSHYRIVDTADCTVTEADSGGAARTIVTYSHPSVRDTVKPAATVTNVFEPTYAIAPSVAADEGEDAELAIRLGQAAPTGGLTLNVAYDYSGSAATADTGSTLSTLKVPAGSADGDAEHSDRRRRPGRRRGDLHGHDFDLGDGLERESDGHRRSDRDDQRRRRGGGADRLRVVRLGDCETHGLGGGERRRRHALRAGHGEPPAAELHHVRGRGGGRRHGDREHRLPHLAEDGDVRPVGHEQNEEPDRHVPERRHGRAGGDDRVAHRRRGRSRRRPGRPLRAPRHGLVGNDHHFAARTHDPETDHGGDRRHRHGSRRHRRGDRDAGPTPRQARAASPSRSRPARPARRRRRTTTSCPRRSRSPRAPPRQRPT